MARLFTATTCPQCTPVKLLIETQNYDVEIVNVDEVGRDVIRELGVRALPTLQADDGSLVTSPRIIMDFLKENF